MFDFIDIPNNKDRTEVIQKFCDLVRLGSHSANELKELRHELVSDYLFQSCSADEQHQWYDFSILDDQ